MRILLLGGTGEARRLSVRLGARPDLAVTLSFAGRTAIPPEQAVPVRVGGFGGAGGLAAYLEAERIETVIDATHPFAARMAANAAAACCDRGTPLVRLVRPAWTAAEGDRWLGVADFAAAARALGPEPRRVFLTIGQGGLETFAALAGQHDYLVRAIGRPTPFDLPRARLLLDRPPYEAAAEEALMRRERIAILVTKNSGGADTAGKLTAARILGLPVIMIERPASPHGVPAFADPDALLAWLAAVQAERGV